MEKLVNDLLYFSRIGRQQLAVKRTDVNAIVRDVVSTMELYLEERHAQVVRSRVACPRSSAMRCG